MEGSAAGRLASARILPTLVHQLDLHHVLRSVKELKLKTCGHKSNALRLAAQVHFSYSLPTAALFDALWTSVLCELAPCEQFSLLAYVQTELLQLRQGRWAAGWQGGLESAVPGHQTGTLTQALERCLERCFNPGASGPCPTSRLRQGRERHARVGWGACARTPSTLRCLNP